MSFEYGGRKFLCIVVYKPNVRSNIFINNFRLHFEYRVANEFKEMMEMFQFENRVEKVPPITGHKLDLVFCNMEHSPISKVC